MNHYVIRIRANWNDLTVGTFDFWTFGSLQDVQKFVKYHIYLCDLFDEMTASVEKVED